MTDNTQALTTTTGTRRALQLAEDLAALGDGMAFVEAALDQDADLSAGTRKAYARELRRFLDWRAGRVLSALLVKAYAAERKATTTKAGTLPRASTVNRSIAAVRWYARKVAALAAEADIPDDRRAFLVAQAERAAAVRDLRNGGETRRGRHLPAGVVEALFRACTTAGAAGKYDTPAARARDAAALALAVVTLARRSELLALDLADLAGLDDQGGAVVVTYRQTKGGKTRACTVDDSGTLAALRAWYAVRGPAAGAFLCPVKKGGAVEVRRMSGTALEKALDKRAALAGLDVTGVVNWHDLRRTGAGNMLDAGADLSIVSRVMGHSDPATTRLYDRRPAEAERRALSSLHAPYMGGR